MITLTCEQCGKPYRAKPYMATKSKRHFCGFKCYGAWQKIHRVGIGRKRVTVTCYTCGKEFERQPSMIAERNFCDRRCCGKWRSSDEWRGENNPAWKGGNTQYRGGNWGQQRRRALRRDNFTCQHCGSTEEGLHVHHIRPFHLFDDYRIANRLDNLTSLCPICHTQADDAFWKENPALADWRVIPLFEIKKKCESCGESFKARSPRSVFCDNCCSHTCAYCEKEFYSRRVTHRDVRYCSRECRNADVRRPTQVCEGCGKEYRPTRPGTRYCTKQCYFDSGHHKTHVDWSFRANRA